MTDIQIKCFLLTCSTLNFARTAEKLNYTPQAISKLIKALEDELGTRLFVRMRSGRNLSLTPAGVYYNDVFTKDKSLKSRTMGDIYGWYRWLAGHFRLGISECIDSFCDELSEALLSFQKAHPNLEFSAVSQDNETLQRELAAGNLDAVLISGEQAILGREIGMTPVAKERRCLVASRIVCEKHPGGEFDPNCWGAPFVQRPIRDVGNTEYSRVTGKHLAELGVYPREIRMMPTVMSINTALMVMECVTEADMRFGHTARVPMVRCHELPKADPEPELCCMWSLRNENPRLTEFIRVLQERFGDYDPAWEKRMPYNGV